MKKEIKLLAGTALLGMSMTAQAGVIDLFETDQAPLVDNTTADGGLSSSVNTLGTDILGGSRDLFVELLDNGGVATREASIGVGGGVLDFSTDTLAAGTGTVQWDGNDGSINLDPTGLGGVDLTEAGTIFGFAVTTLFSDAGYEFLVNAYTDATNWTSISFSATGVVAPTTSFIPFAAFMNPALCGTVNPAPGVNSVTCSDGAGNPGGFNVVDFTNLGALELVIDPNGGSTSIDLTLEQVATVPEPSVLGLIGAGLLAGGLVARRNRKNKAAANA